MEEIMDYNEYVNKVKSHKNSSIDKLSSLLDSYISSEDLVDKADKLSYWIEDYCRMISFEKSFNSEALLDYKRGDVIKVNLGYKIGNEQGRFTLLYCFG